jgi:hypothetical protein
LHAGLCENCTHRKEIRNDRGSLFILCRRGLLDPAWPKYPRLPVLRCAGFEACSLRIIFLDFDGVLVTAASAFRRSGTSSVADPKAVEALNWLVAQTGARLVVTSSWRLDYSADEIRALLRSWGVEGNVLGITGVAHSPGSRGKEIQAWLDEHRLAGPIASFVILDDEPDMGTLSSRLIRTEIGTGLTRGQATMAQTILQAGSVEDSVL